RASCIGSASDIGKFSGKRSPTRWNGPRTLTMGFDICSGALRSKDLGSPEPYPFAENVVESNRAMSVTAHCPKCQRPLAESAPAGLCPVCLFSDMLTPPLEQADGAAHTTEILENSARSTAATLKDYELLEEIAR